VIALLLHLGAVGCFVGSIVNGEDVPVYAFGVFLSLWAHECTSARQAHK
jgi:hypothetical protein